MKIVHIRSFSGPHGKFLREYGNFLRSEVYIQKSGQSNIQGSIHSDFQSAKGITIHSNTLTVIFEELLQEIFSSPYSIFSSNQ